MKGAATRAQILNTAINLVRVEGLDAISIGRLAKSVGLSKSGLFAHFKSKETLQLEILEHAAQTFIQQVVRPALSKPRGEPRLRAMFDNWLRWANAGHAQGGCVFVGAAAEYDDRPGPVRDLLAATQRDWLNTLARAFHICQEEKHLSARQNPEQLAFTLYGIMMSYHLYSRLLKDPLAGVHATRAFDQLLEHAR